MTEQPLETKTSSPGAEGIGINIVLVLLSLAGVVMVLLSTWRFGPATTPDSASYLSAARSLLSGHGYLTCHGEPYIHWPPLLPTLLAAFGFAGIGPLTAARWLNAAAFGLIVLLSGRLFLRSTASRPFTILGTLSVLLSAPILNASVTVWSEPVFIVLVLLFLLCMPGFLRSRRWSRLLLLSAIAGLACLERYAGVTLILSGAILIALNTSGASLWQRLKFLVAFGLLSAAPLAGWFLRNDLLMGQPVGAHHFHVPPVQALVPPSTAAANVVGTWLLPKQVPDSARLVGLSLIFLVALVLVALARLIRRNREPLQTVYVWAAVVFGLVYFGFLVLSGAGLVWIPEQRHMVPMYVSTMLLVFAGANGAARLLSRSSGTRRRAESVVVVFCALWLLHPLTWALEDVDDYWDDGAGGYSVAAWQNSAMMQWLREHPLEGTIYSNVPDAVYILAEQTAQNSPFYTWNTTDWARPIFASSKASYLVWSFYMDRYYMYDLRELLSRFSVEEVATFPDGRVYRLLGEAGPAVTAVYRFWSPRDDLHFYTLDKVLRDRLAEGTSDPWTYERAAFYVFSDQQEGTRPVYRFRSLRGTYFYTIDEAEKEKIVNQSGGVWTDEGIAFYAYPDRIRDDLVPVFRFFSERQGEHFYTASPQEKDNLMEKYSPPWIYEGIAWYAYGPLR